MHHFKRLKSQATKALRTFKFIERTEVATEASLVSTHKWRRKEWIKLPLKERHNKRKEIAEQRIQKAVDKLPQGWAVTHTKHFAILSHASKKYTKRVELSVESCREWLENRLGNVTEEFVGRGIVRICKSRSEYTTYRTGSGDAFSVDDREVVDYENKGAGTSGGGQGHLFYGLYNLLPSMTPGCYRPVGR